MHSTSINGAYFEYTFNGTGIDYISDRDSNRGNLDIYIDGVLQTTVNAYNSSPQVRQVLYSKIGLTEGVHTLKVVKQSGSYADVDILQVYFSQPASILKMIRCLRIMEWVGLIQLIEALAIIMMMSIIQVQVVQRSFIRLQEPGLIFSRRKTAIWAMSIST